MAAGFVLRNRSQARFWLQSGDRSIHAGPTKVKAAARAWLGPPHSKAATRPSRSFR